MSNNNDTPKVSTLASERINPFKLPSLETPSGVIRYLQQSLVDGRDATCFLRFMLSPNFSKDKNALASPRDLLSFLKEANKVVSHEGADNLVSALPELEKIAASLLDEKTRYGYFLFLNKSMIPDDLEARRAIQEGVFNEQSASRDLKSSNNYITALADYATLEIIKDENSFDEVIGRFAQALKPFEVVKNRSRRKGITFENTDFKNGVTELTTKLGLMIESMSYINHEGKPTLQYEVNVKIGRIFREKLSDNQVFATIDVFSKFDELVERSKSSAATESNIEEGVDAKKFAK